jgi:uncharacterized membrane protein
MKKKDTLKIALSGILVALIAIMTFVPQIGYVSFGGVISITLIHIPVIIGIILLDDWRYALVLGLAFGVSSFLRALIAPVAVFDLLFINPFVSILPRFFVGIVGHNVLQLVKRFKLQPLRAGLVAVAATLTNTVLVISALLIFNFSELGGFSIIGGLLLLHATVEIVLAVIVAIVIDRALKSYRTER